MNRGLEGLNSGSGREEPSFEERLLQDESAAPDNSLDQKLFEARFNSILKSMEGNDELKKRVLEALAKELNAGDDKVENNEGIKYEVDPVARKWIDFHGFSLDLIDGKITVRRRGGQTIDHYFRYLPGGVVGTVKIKAIKSVSDVIKIEWTAINGKQIKIFLSSDGFFENDPRDQL